MVGEPHDGDGLGATPPAGVHWRPAPGPGPARLADQRRDALPRPESAGEFAGSAPATPLRQINLATGADILIRPIEGVSFPGTFSAAFDAVVLFSTATGVTAYYGTTGAWLWTIGGWVPREPTGASTGST